MSERSHRSGFLNDKCRPLNPLVVPPHLYRSFTAASSSSHNLEMIIVPTSFGARQPNLPTAKTITLARIATSEGVDKRFERSWVRGLKEVFGSRLMKGDQSRRLVRRGDNLSVPVWKDRPKSTGVDGSESEGYDSDDEDFPDEESDHLGPEFIAYFVVTGLSYEPLVPLEEDFATGISSKARAGELGCWCDVAGEDGSTNMVLAGLERVVVPSRSSYRSWHGLGRPNHSFEPSTTTKFRNIMSSCLSAAAKSFPLTCSILISGSRGSGKMTLIKQIADEVGYSIIPVDAYDLIGETNNHLEGSLQAAMDKAASCSPSILLLLHIDALSRKTESTALGQSPPIVRILQDTQSKMRSVGMDTGFPLILMATTFDVDVLPGEVLTCFKQEIKLAVSDTAPPFDSAHPHASPRHRTLSSEKQCSLVCSGNMISTLKSPCHSLRLNVRRCCPRISMLSSLEPKTSP